MSCATGSDHRHSTGDSSSTRQRQNSTGRLDASSTAFHPRRSSADECWLCSGDGSRSVRVRGGEDTMTELATFGAGCFWGVEVTFRNVKGVKDAAVGYLGGTMENPTYKDVCTGRTGHAEVVQLEYDPEVAAYEKLLEVFWDNHNPTTLNRQGPDVGTQYRSAIFYHTPEQKRIAEESKKKLEESGRFARPIVTEITPASTFYRAEDYHQRYLEKRGLA